MTSSDVACVKQCVACGEHKELSEFYADSKCLDGHMGKCKVCHRARMKARYHEAPGVKDRVRRGVRDRVLLLKGSPEYERARLDTRLRSQYNISLEEYEAMAKSQNWACAGCFEVPEERLHVDHDHACCPGTKSCGACVRALLCRQCNRLLGRIESEVGKRLAEIAARRFRLNCEECGQQIQINVMDEPYHTEYCCECLDRVDGSAVATATYA